MSSDIVIVGAGCMGASTAYHLVQRDPSLQVTVYDRDLSLARASTLLSDGNVRIQFNLEENVLISRYAMEVLERFGDEMAVGDFRPDVGMKKQGNLFFVDEDSQEAARQGLFGPEVAVPEAAPLVDRVIGMTGRRPGWSAG